MLNGQRRDLTADQRCLIWEAAMEKSEAWQARQEGLQAEANRKRSESQKGVPKAEDGQRPDTRSDSRLHPGQDAKAAASNTNRGTVQRMDKLANDHPDLAEKVAQGEIKSAEAMRQMRKADVESKVGALPECTYRVLYADPPWFYGNSGAISESNHYSRVERHYPAMSTADICALPVKDIAADDAVLFLWVSCPLIEEGMKVISAWGFKHKAGRHRRLGRQ